MVSHFADIDSRGRSPGPWQVRLDCGVV